MLVVGLSIVGVAGVLVSNSAEGEIADTVANTGNQRSDPRTAGTGSPLADAQAADDADDTPSGTPEPDVVEAGFGETVTVLDGVKITFTSPRTFDPSPTARVPDGTTEHLAVEVTAVNETQQTVELQPTIWVVNDRSALHQNTPPTGLRYEALEDSEAGLTDSWNGRVMTPGATAYGHFGFGLPADAPAELHGIVWLEPADGNTLAVVFSGTR